MTTAGYIHDQRCPTNPEHGNANTLDAGMYCPHAGHTPVDPEKHTKSFWTWSEWEETKSQANPDSNQSIPATAKKSRSRNAGTNRRRTR